jgi:CheY-like chemotaxis protein
MMDPTHATILLVEDEAAIRSIMLMFLEDVGCEVIEAQDGREGLERYRALPIDAVISDIHMPEMNGLEMIQAIRQYDPVATMIAMSSDPERLSLAHHAGAQQTLKKPFDLSDLRRVVDWIRVHMGWHEICPFAHSIRA